ncbi:MAG: hypothetical protein AAGC47_07735 [Bacteroidota bacterium]
MKETLLEIFGFSLNFKKSFISETIFVGKGGLDFNFTESSKSTTVGKNRYYQDWGDTGLENPAIDQLNTPSE